MRAKRFYMYSDPGHGWLRVKRKHLETLGIANDITPFSYQRGEYVYLEEDCDYSLFHKAYMARTGQRPDIVDRICKTRPSRIRQYACYCPQS